MSREQRVQAFASRVLDFDFGMPRWKPQPRSVSIPFNGILGAADGRCPLAARLLWAHWTEAFLNKPVEEQKLRLAITTFRMFKVELKTRKRTSRLADRRLKDTQSVAHGYSSLHAGVKLLQLKIQGVLSKFAWA